MVDINEWNLHGISLKAIIYDLDFGFSESSDYPFDVQMELGDAERQVADLQHGTDDAVLMGRDVLGGLDLTFSFTTVPDPSDPDRMTRAMDSMNGFGAQWRMSALSKDPSRYATLTNKLRNRYALGRPRNFSPKHARGLRQGQLGWVALFKTATPEFYDAAAVVKNPVRSVGLPVIIAGDLPCFPSIMFTGKFDTATLAYSSVGGPNFYQWAITVNHHLDYPKQASINTHPLFRGASTQDGPINGWLTGSPMSDCYLSPGTGTLTFTTTGTTDAHTACEITWNPAYAGL